MTTNFEMVREFHEAFNVPATGMSDEPTLVQRLDLINEEFTELVDEFGLAMAYADMGQPTLNRGAFTKELCDLLYVVYGAADVLNIDIDAAFAAVHQSNMSKLGEDGKPIFREDGKVLKGPNYQEPQDMERF